MEINQLLKSKKPLLMGIINLTPDSFSDGGKFNTPQKALKQALRLESEGADILDLGAESTGPNSPDVSKQQELKRLISALKLIRKHTKLPISVDTYKSEVARQALEEGANLINDVTALRKDKKLAKIIAHYNCPIILMYSKDNTPRTTLKAVNYQDVIQTIKKFLQNRIKFAEKYGIKNIIIDPGMGAFVSTIAKYSFEIIARLKEFQTLKKPILIGISRKSFLGGSEGTAQAPCPPAGRRSETNNLTLPREQSPSANKWVSWDPRSEPIKKRRSELIKKARDSKSAILSAIAYLNGASIIRTHNIKATKECLAQAQ